MLSNARQVPDPAYNIYSPGFTAATNGQLYIKGSFNADGDPDTGGPTNASDEDREYQALALLAADAITFLSDKFEVEKSRDSSGSREAEFTEINAALMTGLSPTNKGGGNVSSGGSHNFPRFLEDWGGVTFRYRGSLVAFFESEIAKEPWSTSYYSPPRREWGFLEDFSNVGQPPATPKLRAYFKLDYRYLNSDGEPI